VLCCVCVVVLLCCVCVLCLCLKCCLCVVFVCCVVLLCCVVVLCCCVVFVLCCVVFVLLCSCVVFVCCVMCVVCVCCVCCVCVVFLFSNVLFSLSPPLPPSLSPRTRMRRLLQSLRVWLQIRPSDFVMSSDLMFLLLEFLHIQSQSQHHHVHDAALDVRRAFLFQMSKFVLPLPSPSTTHFLPLLLSSLLPL